MERIHKKNNIVLHQDILINTPIDIRIDREQIAKRNQQLADVGNVLDELRSLRKAYLKKPRRASASKYLNMVDKILKYGKDILEIAFKRLGDEFKDKSKVNQRELIQLEIKSFSEGKNFLREDDRFKFDTKNISVQNDNIVALTNFNIITNSVERIKDIIQFTVQKISSIFEKRKGKAKSDGTPLEETEGGNMTWDSFKQSNDAHDENIVKNLYKIEGFTPIGQKVARSEHNQKENIPHDKDKNIDRHKKTTKL